MSDKLTAKQSAFVHHYLLTFNATSAAIRAGYSQKTARQQGARLLSNVDIFKAIETGSENQIVFMSQGEALARLSAFARGEFENAKPQHILRALEMILKVHGVFTDEAYLERLQHALISAIAGALRQRLDDDQLQAVVDDLNSV